MFDSNLPEESLLLSAYQKQIISPYAFVFCLLSFWVFWDFHFEEFIT
jgi:hypothetical protein